MQTVKAHHVDHGAVGEAPRELPPPPRTRMTPVVGGLLWVAISGLMILLIIELAHYFE